MKRIYVKRLMLIGLLISVHSLSAALSEKEVRANITRWYGATFGPVPLLGNLHAANLPKWYNAVQEAEDFARKNITLDKDLVNDAGILVQVSKDMGDAILKLNYLKKQGLIQGRTKSDWLVMLKTHLITLERIEKRFAKKYLLPGNKKAASILLSITQACKEAIVKTINEME